MSGTLVNVVAQIMLDEGERERIDRILDEVDLEGNPLASDLSSRLTDDERRLMREFVRRYLSQVLEIGLLAEAIARNARARQLGDENDAQAFRRDCQEAWLDHFEISSELEEGFGRIAARLETDEQDPVTEVLYELQRLAERMMFGASLAG